MLQISAKAKDTPIMKFDFPEKRPGDVLSLETKMSKERCPQLVLDKAFCNNTELTKTGDKLILPKAVHRYRSLKLLRADRFPVRFLK